MAKDDPKTPEVKKTPAETEAADAKAKADAEAKAAEEAEAAKGLVKVYKNGESLLVHPTTVQAHIDAGWNRA